MGGSKGYQVVSPGNFKRYQVATYIGPASRSHSGQTTNCNTLVIADPGPVSRHHPKYDSMIVVLGATLSAHRFSSPSRRGCASSHTVI